MQLLNDGIAPLSIEMRMAIDKDVEQEKGGPVIFADDPAVVEANAPAQEAEQEESVVESTATVEDVPERKEAAPQKTARQARTPSNGSKRGEPKNDAPIPMQGDLSDYMNPPVDADGNPFR